MVPDWMQMGLLLAASYVLGAARLPSMPLAVARGLAVLRGIAIIWIARFIMSGEINIELAELHLSESILMLFCMVAGYLGTHLPLVRVVKAVRQSELGFVLIGTVAGVITLVDAPTSIVLAVSGILLVLAGRSLKQNVPALIPLLAGIPILVYAAGDRTVAVAVAVIVMGITLLFEVSRLLWPAWNRQVISRWTAIARPREFVRPLALSSAAVAVALLVSVLTAHTALLSGAIGLLLPTIVSILTRDLMPQSPHQTAKLAGQTRLLAVGLAVMLVLALVLPSNAGERPAIGLATLLTGTLLLIPMPIDRYLIGPLAAAATLIAFT